MSVIITVFAIIIFISNIIKVYEIWVHSIIWIYKNGERCCEDFHKNLHTTGPSAAISIFSEAGYLPWPVWQKIYQAKPGWIFKNYANYLYRIPTLALTSSFLSIFTDNNIIFYLMIFTSVSIIFTRLIQQIISRIKLGVADNLTQYYTPTIVDIKHISDINWNVSKILRDTLSNIIAYTFICVMSYAFMYYSLDNFSTDNFSPKGDSLNLFKSIYFSIVTITTVGFGEIHPTSDMAIFLVTSEIISVWSMVVIVFFHYAGSLSINLDKYQ